MTATDTKMTIISAKEINSNFGATVLWVTSLCWLLNVGDNLKMMMTKQTC